MTLLEKIEQHLPYARELTKGRNGVVESRYAWFDPLTLAELEEIAAALRKAK